MLFSSFDDYRHSARDGRGPVAILLCEDGFLAAAAVGHLRRIGFREIVAAGPGAEDADAAADDVAAFPAPIADAEARARLLNLLIAAFKGRWAHISFNDEFPFFPFSGDRSIRDFTDFLQSERRTSCGAYAIDLYSDSLAKRGEVDLDDVYFDREGWYGFDRDDGLVEVFGGLGWRFEEYSPVALSRVNRPALFLATEETRIRADLWLEDDARNAIACPWHNNPTMAEMSFRRARRMLSHPNFKGAIDTLMWPNSERFTWTSAQLVSRGLVEAGQWI